MEPYQDMLRTYWRVDAPCTVKAKSLLKRHCQGYPVTAYALYKEIKGESDQANRELLIQLIANRAPVAETASVKELEQLLGKLDKGEPLPPFKGEIDFAAYQLPQMKVSQVCHKNYCKKGRCLASLAEAVIVSASTDDDKRAADRVVSHYVTKHLLSQGYNMGNFLDNAQAIAWTPSRHPLAISWNNPSKMGDDRVDMFLGETAIINSGESLVMVEQPDRPLVPSNSKIYFVADQEGTYPLTSFSNPGKVLTIEVYDRESVLAHLPKLPKAYSREFLHQIRRWIELDNYLKTVEMNSLNAPLEDRQCILEQVCRAPTDESRLQQAIADNIIKRVSSANMDPVCRVVFDTWKKNATPGTEELLMTCLVDGKVSFDRVTSVINKELVDNAMTRERLQQELRNLLGK